MRSKINLERLPAGACGRIAAVEASPTDVDRLEVMGLCVGRRVEVAKAGDPLIVRVLGTRIGLAGVLARAIMVETEPAG